MAFSVHKLKILVFFKVRKNCQDFKEVWKRGISSIDLQRKVQVQMEDPVSLASGATQMRFCQLLGSLHSLENFVMTLLFSSPDWFNLFYDLCSITEHIDFATQLQEPAMEPLCNPNLPASMHTLDHLQGVSSRASLHYTGESQLKEVCQSWRLSHKVAVPWQIQGTFSSVPCLQKWPSVSECLDKTVRTTQAESNILPECFPSHLWSDLREILKHR